MSEYINTKRRTRQYNGPLNSDDHNARIEENYQDLVYLYNKHNVIDQKLSQAFERVLKDHVHLSQYLSSLEDRVRSLENTSNQLSIYSFSQVNNSAIPAGELSIGLEEALSVDPAYNIITLPKIDGASHSKIKFFTPNDGQIIPDFFETKISNSLPGVDVPGAIIDGTSVYNAILDRSDKFWKRSVITSSTSSYGAQMYLYVKIPSEYTGSTKCNFIKMNPFPVFGVDILSIEYTTTKEPTMTESDTWYPLNKDALFEGTPSAVGKVPPGGWSLNSGTPDTINNSGPIAFYFPETEITAMRFVFRQRKYFTENNNNIYTYGLSDLDIRYDKFFPTGRAIFKFDAPTGYTISEIVSVTPKIYNVSPALYSDAFSYRVIYNDGSIYTTENPGSSNSVWIEVTLNQMPDGTAPVLSDLIIDYN